MALKVPAEYLDIAAPNPVWWHLTDPQMPVLNDLFTGWLGTSSGSERFNSETDGLE